jgi:hypothetical protein
MILIQFDRIMVSGVIPIIRPLRGSRVSDKGMLTKS